jgi:hypothetical protein
MSFAPSEEAVMSFRHISAWINLLTHIGVYGGYFLILSIGHYGDFRSVLLGAIFVIVLLNVTLHIAAALISPRAAAMPRDERERLIEARSTSPAYFVLATGAVTAAAAALWGVDANWVGNGLLMTLVAAEIAKSGCQIVFFAKGI